MRMTWTLVVCCREGCNREDKTLFLSVLDLNVYKIQFCIYYSFQFCKIPLFNKEKWETHLRFARWPSAVSPAVAGFHRTGFPLFQLWGTWSSISLRGLDDGSSPPELAYDKHRLTITHSFSPKWLNSLEKQIVKLVLNQLSYVWDVILTWY